ncbi:MAG: hypothetical protein ACPG77_12090, partial [Nannocystaceae bacterium]
ADRWSETGQNRGLIFVALGKTQLGGRGSPGRRSGPRREARDGRSWKFSSLVEVSPSDHVESLGAGSR